jgi:hypothetical protein
MRAFGSRSTLPQKDPRIGQAPARLITACRNSTRLRRISIINGAGAPDRMATTIAGQTRHPNAKVDPGGHCLPRPPCQRAPAGAAARCRRHGAPTPGSYVDSAIRFWCAALREQHLDISVPADPMFHVKHRRSSAATPAPLPRSRGRLLRFRWTMIAASAAGVTPPTRDAAASSVGPRRAEALAHLLRQIRRRPR